IVRGLSRTGVHLAHRDGAGPEEGRLAPRVRARGRRSALVSRVPLRSRPLADGRGTTDRASWVVCACVATVTSEPRALCPGARRSVAGEPVEQLGHPREALTRPPDARLLG